MKLFPTKDIKQIDAYTIAHEPISSIDLMERAACALTEAITARWSDASTPFIVFAGPGNNGGDALAVARLLSQRGYRHIDVFLFNVKGSLSPDCLTNFERLKDIGEVTLHEITSRFNPPALTDTHVVIDGLFGSGLNKPLSGGFAAVVQRLNSSPATVVAIDVPSGLMGEDNTYNQSEHILKADVTLTLQMPKVAFLFAENQDYVGEWQALDIGLSREAIDSLPTDYSLTEHEEMARLVRPRKKFAHKGNFGRALLIAGSEGMAGASVLAARACLKSGVGLLTVHVPFCNNSIVQTSVPEAMTQIDPDNTCFTASADTGDFQAVGIGPGLRQSEQTMKAVYEQVEFCQAPMVIDADALNLLARRPNLLKLLPPGSVLTPHPRELERMVGKCRNSYERLMRARDLSSMTNSHIVLKGAYTAVVSPQGSVQFNPTGNPGMATGGSGDVLTGILLALLAQGYKTEEAARLAVYVHGLAGDMAAHRLGEISMTAGDIVTALPAAWKMMTTPGNDE